MSSALRAIITHLKQGNGGSGQVGGNDQRSGRDRRKNQRRSNVFPLQDKEMRLRCAAQAAGLGIYDLDCLTGESTWSPELKAMAGLPADDAILTMERIEQLIHPEDRERFASKMRDSMLPASDGFDDQFRLLRPDGGVRWLKARGYTLFVRVDGQCRPLMATGIVTDVTASLEAERALHDSRAELAGLIDSVLDAIISVDAEQRIVLFNTAACRMFGCSVDEAVGSPIERFIPVAARAAHREHVRKFMETGTTARAMGQPGVFSGLRTNGEQFPIEASISKVEVGGQWHMTVVVRDITERKEAEEALRRSREDLELAVHGANMGIWNWDMRTGEMVWSARFYELLGIPRTEPASQERFLAALSPEDSERTLQAVSRARQTGEEISLEYRVVWPDDSVHWLAVVGRCFHEQGMPVRMAGVVLDITERRQSEEDLRSLNQDLERRIAERTAELRHSNDALARSNLDLQQFAYIAAHDLQTPLRSISGFAQLLQKDYFGKLDPKADVWLTQLMRSAERMHELVQDLLIYSRVDSRGHTFRPVDLNQLFRDVLITLDADIRESEATVTCDPLPVILGDPTQLAQLLQNLIGNAIKYRGDEPPKVHVTATRDDGLWLFSVSDNGIGIPAKHLDHIFDIFYRLHTQEEYPGTGIGLAVCRRVVHRHGGKIWAESRTGEGSVFYFTLPQSEPANTGSE